MEHNWHIYALVIPNMADFAKELGPNPQMCFGGGLYLFKCVNGTQLAHLCTRYT